MTPSAERFRSLARSSRWRWETLRFRFHATWRDEPVRAWVRRPDSLRVERLDGSLVVAERQPPNHPVPLVRLEAGEPLPGPPEPVPPPVAEDLVPLLDDEGLVRARPFDSYFVHGDPYFGNYRWMAMLDPFELADGWEADEPADPTLVEDLHEVDHHGRAAWEALLQPTASYASLCPCCPLLFSTVSEARHSAPTITEREPGWRYADAHRIRLDVGTGVCVLTEELGGSNAGAGHELVIEAVDEPMADELFAPPA